jgi:SNF2 family DNA or RNA helicase
MWIDTIDSGIKILETKGKISSIHISQLYYFGFKKIAAGEYVAETDNPDGLLERIINYFSETDEKFDLSKTCLDLINNTRIRKEQFAQLLTYAKDFKNGKYDKNTFNKFNQFLDITLKRKLRDHQKKAAYHLLIVGNGANFSVPGSGKTTVLLAVYEKLRLDGLLNTLFVIGPPACFGPWQNEFIETLGRKPDCRILAGGEFLSRKLEYYNFGNNKGELYLTTFQTLLNDIADVQKFLSNNNVKAYVVVDEAHYIKQIGGEWAKAVLSLAPFAKYRCVLTGTPLPRAYSDAFNLFDFLFPENPPLDSFAKSKIELLEKQKSFLEVKNIFEQKVEPLIYRVRKKDLGLIPAIFHPPVLVEMNKYEKILYDAIVKKIRDYSKDDYHKNIDLIIKLMRGRIIRLRQCVSYSKLLATAIDDYDEDLFFDESNLASLILDYDRLEKPGKLIKLLQMIEKLQSNRQKVVIWSNFRETLRLIKREIITSGFKSEMIYGDTPTESTPFSVEKTRDEIRDEFVLADSGLDILIANPAACAESISLHKTCFHAIYYDLSYNCAQYLQSLDRIHRVGGSEKEQANYHFLQYENSIDQDISLNLDEKAQRMYSLIDKEYDIYTLDMFSDNNEIEAYKRIFGVTND